MPLRDPMHASIRGFPAWREPHEREHMGELKRCFEHAGYERVRTVLSSGNVACESRRRSEAALAHDIEAGMQSDLGRTFATIVRSSDWLQHLVEADPFARYRLPSHAKRVVTFLRERHASKLELPIELDGARILAVDDGEVFSAYVPGPKGPVFMTLIENTFGKEVTTRTWDSVRKCAKA